MKTLHEFSSDVARFTFEDMLREAALSCLQGYLASGRKTTVENGKEISIEEAAILRAKNLLALLEKENK